MRILLTTYTLMLLAVPLACQKSSPSDAAHSTSPNKTGAAQTGTQPISGTITVAPGLEDAIGASDVLFIMARAIKDGKQGQLIAVMRRKLQKDNLPMRFELSSADVMTGAPFAGPFIVYARLDKDGDPMSKTAQDLYAHADAPAPNGTKNIQLVLNKAPQGASAPASLPTSAPAPSGPSSSPGSAAPPLPSTPEIQPGRPAK
ncbi:MAG: hypothetical protein KTR25_10235 [Myxococcales bacterium]|nr:hypothetical protein [Myxococcales bacterium]